MVQVHWPIRFAKNCGQPGEIDDKHKLGYSSEMMQETWAVRIDNDCIGEGVGEECECTERK